MFGNYCFLSQVERIDGYYQAEKVEVVLPPNWNFMDLLILFKKVLLMLKLCIFNLFCDFFYFFVLNFSSKSYKTSILFLNSLKMLK